MYGRFSIVASSLIICDFVAVEETTNISMWLLRIDVYPSHRAHPSYLSGHIADLTYVVLYVIIETAPLWEVQLQH